MKLSDPNRRALLVVVERLEPRLGDFLFVGGATVGLFLTDAATLTPRPTKDIDVVVRVASLAEYSTKLRTFLLEREFKELTEEGAPICAWSVAGIRVDVMPTKEGVLGFSNRWLGDAFERPATTVLDGHRLRHASGPYFLALKLEAFHSRGNGDYHASDDMEDLLLVVDGRPELGDEVARASGPVRHFIGESVREMLQSDRFLHALPGHTDVGREEVVLERLGRMAAGSSA